MSESSFLAFTPMSSASLDFFGFIIIIYFLCQSELRAKSSHGLQQATVARFRLRFHGRWGPGNYILVTGLEGLFQGSQR